MGLRIALLGTRGIPARYGGFETFAQELSQRLVARGHEVTVYGRRPFFTRASGGAIQEYKGVSLITTPTIMQKYLETPLHALTSFLDLFRRQFDVALLCNAANAPFAFLIRLRGLPLLINVDGIERKRSKWNGLGKLWYRLGEVSAVAFATRVIADAQVIADYYLEFHKTPSLVIAYGANAVIRPAGQTLESLQVKSRQYLLYVSRLEPENNALGVIQAYQKIKDPKYPLVIVGDAPYADEYKKELRQQASGNPQIRFAGYQFGEAYQELQSNCYLYIQATEVGGTHPALIEAMAYGNCVIANGTEENHEVLAETGTFYSRNNFDQLSEVLEQLMSAPQKVEELGVLAKKRAQSLYSWDAITDQYEAELIRVAKKESISVIDVRSAP